MIYLVYMLSSGTVVHQWLVCMSIHTPFRYFSVRRHPVESLFRYPFVWLLTHFVWNAGWAFVEEVEFYRSINSVNMIVDSALATKTKTSESKQNLSIHSSKSVSTSMPGESIKTTSSSSILHLSLGQTIRTLALDSNLDEQSALPNCPMD